MTFTLIESDLLAPEEPLKALKERFKPPYKTWLNLHEWRTGKAEDKYEKMAPGLFKSEDLQWKKLQDTLIEQGPFDGVLAFSQGAIFYRHVHRLLLNINPILKRVYLPPFMISFSGCFFPHQCIEDNGVKYPPQGYKTRIDILHIYGKQDPYLEC